ncbi:3-oxoacyl-[acyl-carrier protein] reductase [Enhygromyxa salina]|uniref:3-oxoacyl-[acyl-carrier protein] reductase n=1 Tax=Enhygromyxa salina TaxID=215803 RepID=A0A0C2CZU3_9BACT|nr:SDR family NAD(P)-dependent oxidoreductase [Enhygromyxa salina]KIG16501.1 3-oxoacyl-[acyl-carrier protein] reductase [Enhygromyxa salina]
MDVAGKLVVITGASQGMGAGTSLALGKQGARVILVARTKAKLQAIADQITAAGGEAHVRPCDLSDPASVTALGEEVTSSLGVPDVIINNAGAGRWLAVDETPLEEAVQMMQAPYFAAFFVTRVFLPAMIERRSGLIVNVQSPMSRVVAGGCTGYAACRWALRGFNEGLRADLRGTGVRVTEVMFGEVTSDYWDNNPGAKERLPGIANMLIPTMTTEQVGAAMIKAIRAERRVFMRPFMLTVIVCLLWMFPSFVRWLTVRTGWQRELS